MPVLHIIFITESWDNMGFLDTFKGKQYKQQSENLQAELDRLKSTFTPEMRNASELMKLTDKLNDEIRSLNQTISYRNETISSLDSQISSLNDAIKYRQDEIINLDGQIEIQSFGLYTPKYDFASSDIYKDRLTEIRNKQKTLIKEGKAVGFYSNIY